MTGIEQSAAAMYDRAFTRLPAAEQDVVLRVVQAGTASGAVWAHMDAARYFEELLALVTDIYYSHPLASEEIGYVGMADAHGWQAIGLGEHEGHEPVAREAHGSSSSPAKAGAQICDHEVGPRPSPGNKKLQGAA